MFEVIPAIDVLGGRLARMRRGDRSTLREHQGDPVEVAERFVEQGARWIHVVDLDVALGNGPGNRDVLRRVASLDVRVQAGGGLSPDQARDALESGASRAVIGSGALDDREAVEGTLAELGDRVAVGLDVRDGRIHARARGEAGPLLADVVPWLAAAGCVRVVHTDVARDGVLAGPDLVGLASLGDVPWSVIASGGIRSRSDLEAIASLGVEGAIVGTAIYEAGLDLADALRGLA